MKVRFASLALVFSALLSSAQVAHAQIALISAGTSGAPGNGASYAPSLSSDGRFVAFCSAASDLVAGDTNGVIDVFVRDRTLGTTERVSVTSEGIEGNADSCDVFLGSQRTRPLISASGRFVAFLSNATNLSAPVADTNDMADIFLHDRLAKTTARISVAPDGSQLARPFLGVAPVLVALSDDGRKAVMSFILPGGTYIYDATTRVTTFCECDVIVSRTRRTVDVWSAGLDFRALFDGQLSDDLNRYVSGRVVVVNRVTGERDVLDELAIPVAVSEDGRIVLLRGANEPSRWFVWNRRARGIVPLPGFEGEQFELSRDGRYVVTTDSVLPGRTTPAVVITNLTTGLHWPLDVSPSGAPPAFASSSFSDRLPNNAGVVMARAETVAFASTSTNLLAPGADVNGVSDVFVRRNDMDGDTFPDEWEFQFGLDPYNLDGLHDDPDGDGEDNISEYVNRTHPTGTISRHFAEGTRKRFFSTQFALLNPSPTVTARVLLRFIQANGSVVTSYLAVPPLARGTVPHAALDMLEELDFDVTFQSNVPVVIDRTMTWGVDGYGSHAETSQPAKSRTWYLAEGATHSGFDLFYLISSPRTVEADVQVTYLLPSGPPIRKSYRFPNTGRLTIWVDNEDVRLTNADVSAIITCDEPVLVERAMYLSTPSQPFTAGHVSSGVTEPATEWFLAEGATGDYFDLFILVGNPTDDTATIEATYLLPEGDSVVKTYSVAPKSRMNLWVDAEDPRLRDTAVSTIIRSTNGVPVIVERSMWWPGPTAATWAEAHNSFGTTVTGRTWGIAEGEQGGAHGAETFILIANRGQADVARVSLYFEDGTSVAREFVLPANSRTNVAVGFEFPAAADRRFGAIVEALGPTPEIVVERALYSNAGGVFWAAGANVVATKLQ